MLIQNIYLQRIVVWKVKEALEAGRHEGREGQHSVVIKLANKFCSNVVFLLIFNFTLSGI